FPVSGREIIREPGDLLWSEREGPAGIAKAKITLGSYAYAGQYQQEPAPAGGGLFKRGWVKGVVPPPAECRWGRYWDKARAAAGGGAYRAGVMLGAAPDGRYYVGHVVRGQWSALEREQVIRATAAEDGRDTRIFVEQEPGSGGKESAEATVRSLAGYIVAAER